MGPQGFKAGFGTGVIAAVLSLAGPAYGTGCTESSPFVCTTTNETFFLGITSGQPRRFIDFETLPNGQPSVGGTPITPEFNYTSLGVSISAPFGTPTIGGFVPGTFDLHVSTTNFTHTWLRADFVHPSSAVGVYFPGATTLTAFDSHGSIIASQSYGASGGPWFIGIYSEIPIEYVTIDRGSDSQFLNDIIFSLTPEPASVFLLMAGIGAPLTGRRRV